MYTEEEHLSPEFLNYSAHDKQYIKPECNPENENESNPETEFNPENEFDPQHECDEEIAAYQNMY